MMARIWANCLETGTQVWNSVPETRREAVKAVLRQDVETGRISAEKYKEICWENF